MQQAPPFASAVCGSAHSTKRHTSAMVDTFDLSHTAASLMPPPASDAPAQVHMDFLHQQLDSIGVERPILDGLLLLGSGTHQRLQGGVLLHACVRCAGKSADAVDTMTPALSAVHVGILVCLALTETCPRWRA